MDGWHVAPSALGRGDDVNPSLAETGSYPTLTEADQKDGDLRPTARPSAISATPGSVGVLAENEKSKPSPMPTRKTEISWSTARPSAISATLSSVGVLAENEKSSPPRYMLFFLNSFTLLSRLSLSNTVSNIACKIDEEELHYVFVPMHISAIPPMKKDLVMSAKRGLCHYKSFSCLTLYFFRLFSASAIWCSTKFNMDRQMDGRTTRNLLSYFRIRMVW